MLRSSAIQKGKQVAVSNFYERVFLQQKLGNPLGYVIIALVAITFGFLLAQNMLVGIGVFVGVIGLAIGILCMISTEIGLYANLVFAFTASMISRLLFMGEFPIGIVSDLLVLITFLGIFFGKSDVSKVFKTVTSSAIVTGLLLYTGYIMIQLFNPYAHSFDGWFQTIRKFFICILVIYLSFKIFQNPAAIKRFLIVLFIVSVSAGIYGCIQQWHGLFPFEMANLYKQAQGRELIFINGGELRKFSMLSDPLSFGVVMAASSILFLIVSMHVRNFWYKLIIISGCIIMILGMSYSGTRTANVMIIAGLLMFVLLTINKRSTKIFGIVALLIFLFLLYAPIYSNGTLNRFRTSFLGSKDASFNVREVNRKFIQPYIYSHPIGGGLCTCGEPGLRYNPGHQLAGFPPDSSYLRKALETGWIGLVFILLLYFVSLRYGIRGYFLARTEGRKVLLAACVSTMFALYIAEFPQEALGNMTDMLVYYPIIAILIRLRSMEKHKQDPAEIS